MRLGDSYLIPDATVLRPGSPAGGAWAPHLWLLRQGEAMPAVFFVGVAIFVLFVTVLSLAVQCLFLFAYPLIADRNLPGLEAIKLSYRAALQNLSGIIGLILLLAGMGIVFLFGLSLIALWFKRAGLLAIQT